MGDGEQSKENHGDAVDGWFDLLDDSIMSEARKRSSARPPSAGRPSNGHNLSGLNEISNKITPVMLAPVHHLLPIEPSHPSSEPRDVWETDPNETTSSFEIVGALDQGVLSDSLPPLQELGERGDGFLDFSDPPPMSRRTRNFDQATDGLSFEAGAKSASHMRSSSPPEASNDDESFAGLDPDSIPVSTPLSNTLFATRETSPAVPTVEEEDSFDLSDFDRWGRDDEAPAVEVHNDAVASIAEDPHDFNDPPAPALALERDPFEADANDIDGLLCGGAFATPPDDETFAEAVTRPRIEIPESLRGGPVRPSSAPVDLPPASIEEARLAHVHPPPLPRQGPPPLPPRQRPQPTPATPVRPIPAVVGTPSTSSQAIGPSSIPSPSLPPVRPSAPMRPDGVGSMRDAFALRQSVLQSVAAPTPGAIQDPSHNTRSSREAPKPASGPDPFRAVRPSHMPASPPVPVAASSTATAPPAGARRYAPQQEMHERFDLGDFTGALSIAETMLEVDPDNAEATHIAEVSRAKLRAIYIGRLGSLEQVPVISTAPSELRWLALDHRAGFILSLVDGLSSLDDIIDISGMPQLEALRTLYTLSTQQIIALRKR